MLMRYRENLKMIKNPHHQVILTLGGKIRMETINVKTQEAGRVTRS